MNRCKPIRQHIHDMGTCISAGKKCFGHSEATKVAVALRRRNDSNHHEYRCSACGYSHVGSTLRPLKDPCSRRSNRNPKHRGPRRWDGHQ